MGHDEEDRDRDLTEPEGVDSEGVAETSARFPNHTPPDPGPPRPGEPFRDSGDNGSLLAAGKVDTTPQPGQEISVGEG